MKGDYPRFRASYQHEELVEHFFLHTTELEFAQGFRGDVNRNAVAVLLKSLLYLGYFPESLVQVPESVRTFIANQLSLLWDHTPLYRWQSGTKDHHLSLIRKYTGWRFPIARDKEELEQWLQLESTEVVPTEEELLERAYERLRALRVELPAEMELRRIVNAALSSFFQNLYQCISARLSGNVRANIDRLLVVASDEAISPFDKLKPDPSAPSVDNLKKEVEKLQQLRGLSITADDLTDVPAKALHILSAVGRKMNVQARCAAIPLQSVTHSWRALSMCA